jgi:hypothetical protein
MSQVNPSPTSRNDDSYTSLDNASSDDIKNRIDRTREAMDETLDELGERLNPHTLLDEALAIFRSPQAKESAMRAKGMVGDFAYNLGRQVRDNPIPTILIGAGLAWLAFGSHDDSHEDDYLDDEYLDDESMADTWRTQRSLHRPMLPEAYASGNLAAERGYGRGDLQEDHEESLTSRAKRSASAVGESMADTAASIGETVSQAAAATKDAVTGVASSIGSAMSSAGETASGAAKRGYEGATSTYRSAVGGGRRAGRAAKVAYRSSVEQLSEVYDLTSHRLREAHQEYPLGVGLGCLALGALAGLAIPRTRQEDEWMGESAERFREEAWHAGEEALERGKESVRETVETAKQSAEKHGLMGDTLVNRATHVVEKVAHTLSEAAQEEGLHPQQLKKDAEQVVKETSQKAQQEVGALTEDAQKKVEEVDPDVKKATEGAPRSGPGCP